MINPIKSNIGLLISSETSRECLQLVYNSSGCKLSAVYINQTNLNVKLSTKLGGPNRGAAKNIWGAWPTQASPLELAL